MKILIVKLGAMGDVLRTTPLLTELKRQYPEARIDWLVDKACREALDRNPLIDRLLDDPGSLKNGAYDLAMNFDKEDAALEAIMAVSAKKKMGFGRSGEGKLCPLDERSAYAYRLGIDDALKFRQNTKTYQEITFEQAGLKFKGEEYVFAPQIEDLDFARLHLKTFGVGLSSGPRLIVGINTGSGKRFAGKKLPAESYAELARLFYKDLGATVFLLGGEEEVAWNQRIERLCETPVFNTGSHTLRRFAAIVKACDLVISGDTIAMHIAIAVRVPVVVFFGSTSASEIELYGRGRKVVSKIPCAPCYLKNCPIGEKCMKETTAGMIFDAAREVLAGVVS
ncbi:MAG: glycosyltransferase family 9 protein [Candidatus Omnitrophica bacterium]|nr:glycosyltransferase family 9 protein [Candidatus Omnitrophota bacterium]